MHQVLIESLESLIDGENDELAGVLQPVVEALQKDEAFTCNLLDSLEVLRTSFDELKKNRPYRLPIADPRSGFDPNTWVVEIDGHIDDLIRDAEKHRAS